MSEFFFLTDLKMDAKVESPSSPSRCKSLYDNGPVEWKSEVYYPFHTAYNNNNKASCYQIHMIFGDRIFCLGYWVKILEFQKGVGNDVWGFFCVFGFWGFFGGWGWNAYLLQLFKLPIHQSIPNMSDVLNIGTIHIIHVKNINLNSGNDHFNIRAQLSILKCLVPKTLRETYLTEPGVLYCFHSAACFLFLHSFQSS